MTDLELEVLSTSDVPENVALVRSAGWHDSEGDWRVLHAGAFVLGARHAGRLVAQGALGDLGRAGTIAKMIVAKEFQRQGLGVRLMEALLAEARRRNIDQLGLVATPFGRPLYEKFGFVPVGDLVVMTGSPNAPALGHEAERLETVDPILELDRKLIHCNREPVLRARFAESIAAACSKDVEGGVGAYAMATAQEPYSLIGPVVAKSEDHARAVVSSLFRALGGGVRIDVPAEQVAFREWLRGLGLEETIARPEMSNDGKRLPWQVPERFALITQAWG